MIFHNGGVEMLRFSSKVIIPILLCLSLTIKSFALTSTVESIKIDGVITVKEWGNMSSIFLMKNDEVQGFYLGQLFVVKDIKKSEICVGSRVAEEYDCSEYSSVRFIFDDDYTITACHNRDIFETKSYIKESGIYKVSDDSYSVEARIIYPGLSKNTRLKVVLIDTQGKETPAFGIDLNNMEVIQEDKDNQQKKEEVTTGNNSPKTTKRATTNNKATKKEYSLKSKSDFKSQNVPTVRSKSKKAQTNPIYSENSDEDENYNENVQISDVLSDNINQHKGHTEYRKIVGTVFAVLLLITAAVLPIFKNTKSKETGSTNIDDE